MLWRSISQRKLLKKGLSFRKDKVSRKSRALTIDTKLSKLNLSPVKKPKTKLSSILSKQIRERKNQKSGNFEQVVEGVETSELVSEPLKKDSSGEKPLAVNRTKPKRKRFSFLRNQIRNRKRRKMAEVNGVDDKDQNIDRISELPEPIIHQIVSFLRCPKDVARTGVLSKKWKKLWASFFSIDFDQRKFIGQGGEKDDNIKFRNFVENSLAIKLEPMLGIQKFRLYLTTFNSKLASDVNNWVTAAINKNVKELEIHVEEKKRRRYVLPRNVLTAKTITSLKLYACKLDNYGAIDLPHLKELSIKRTNLTVDIIQTFIRCCPLIEDLRLVHSFGLNSLQISNLTKLRRVELHECHGLKLVEIDLPNLESFWYCGRKSWECKVNLAGCGSLRYLTLKDSNMTDELFHAQISKFPLLEKLVLKECNILETITILSKNLKGLSIIRCKRLEEAIIDAPNLFSLEYTGDKIPFSSMNIDGLLEVKFHFEKSLKKDSSVLLLELQKFIRKFDKHQAWKLVVNSKKEVIIYEELEGVQLLPLNDLKVELTKSSSNLKDLVDNLLRMSHPKTLSLISFPNSEFLKFLLEKMMVREVNPTCCTYYSKKCWLHYLKDVDFFTTYLVSSQTACQTTFILQWSKSARSDEKQASSIVR